MKIIVLIISIFFMFSCISNITSSKTIVLKQSAKDDCALKSRFRVEDLLNNELIFNFDSDRLYIIDADSTIFLKMSFSTTRINKLFSKDSIRIISYYTQIVLVDDKELAKEIIDTTFFYRPYKDTLCIVSKLDKFYK